MATRKRGRPPVGPLVNVHMPPALIAQLDAEAERRCVSRAALIRYLLTRALGED